jgi:hypothetical protein
MVLPARPLLFCLATGPSVALRNLVSPPCRCWALICSCLAASTAAGDFRPLRPQKPCLGLQSCPPLF